MFFLTFSTWSSVLVKADSPSKGTLTIHKYEQEKDGAQGLEGDGSANQEVPKDAKPLKGVTFEVKRLLLLKNFKRWENRKRRRETCNGSHSQSSSNR